MNDSFLWHAESADANWLPMCTASSGASLPLLFLSRLAGLAR